MKANFFKTSLSIAVFAFAILGAFASQKTSTKVLAPEKGWIDTPAPCQEKTNCSNVSSPFVCTLLHEGELKQAYGKDTPEDVTCTKILYRVEE
jgi:hypothetical protein